VKIRFTLGLDVDRHRDEPPAPAAEQPAKAPVVDVKHASSLERSGDPGMPGMGFLPNHMKPWWDR
jgi:hypothetical protein